MSLIEPVNHIFANFIDCDYGILSNNTYLMDKIKNILQKNIYEEIKESFFILNPGGTTIIFLVENYNIIITTDIESKQITVNIFTDCNTDNFIRILNSFKEVFIADSYNIQNNGRFKCDNSIIDKLRNKIENNKLVLSILGSGGGVAKSILSIINKAYVDENDPINKIISMCKLHLIDKEQKELSYYESHFPNIKNKITLHQFDVNNYQVFKTHLKESNTTIVIDISFADTVDTLKCCNELGVIYINSAFESIEVDEDESLAGFSLQERYEIFEKNRKNFNNTLAIICSEMNPGVVQWMAIELMNKYHKYKPKACYIVENDTSFFKDNSLIDKDTIYTTWYPEGFLDEAIYSYPTFMKRHRALFLYKEVYELEFKVTLGKKFFYGCLMPHEEAITLGKMYDMEVGFIYKINDHTTNLIKENIKDLDSLWNRKMVVLDPEVSPLIGDDLVGVLLVLDDKEVYMYNKLNNEKTYKKYGTNATYHQVACGLYGALASVLLDSLPKGIYYIDELLNKTNSKYGEYLSYHLKEFEFGENKHSDGDLLDRMIEVKKYKNKDWL